MTGVSDPLPARRWPLAAWLGLAVVGAGLAVAGLYGIGLVGRNGADPALAMCRPAVQVAQRLKPLAAGEVAAFQPARAPLSVADIPFTRADGQPTTLGAHGAGKVVLLNLWATWCAPCRKEMPSLDALQVKLGGPGFEVVTINVDTGDPQKPKDFLIQIEARALPLHTDRSLQVFNTLKARGRAIGMPVTMLIDAKGCELGTLNGAAYWDKPDALALIRAALTP